VGRIAAGVVGADMQASSETWGLGPRARWACRPFPARVQPPIGKLLVVLVYQLVLTGVVLAILGAFTGQVALVVLYALLGDWFSLALGLLLGAALNTVSAATAAAGPIMIIYILAGLFVGPLGQLLGNTPASWVAKALPTYYVAEGVYNASQELGSFGSNMLDVAVILGSTVVLLAISAWILRRQSAIAAAI
jgi:ABC-2 type transport system permease protein